MKDVIEELVTGVTTGLVVGIVLSIKNLRKSWKGLDHTTDRIAKCRAILSEVRDELDASRVFLWDGSNGTQSLSGYHIQKLTMFSEVNRDGLPDIAYKFENIPSQKLQRFLLSLAYSDDSYIISYESLEKDDLATIHKNHNMDTLLLVRIESSKKGWVGILSVGWDSEKIPSEYEIAFAKLKASQLGAIDKN